VAAFVTVLSTWVLEPSLESIAALSDPRNHKLLEFLPSYWFFSLFQQLNGSMQSAFLPLAHRAWWAVGIAAVSGSSLLLLAWALRMRTILEQADMLASRRGSIQLRQFRASLRAAFVVFSMRCLMRSQQHRILYAFYMSIGLVMAGFYILSPQVRMQLLQNRGTLPPQILTATLMLLCFSVLAARLVIGFPFSLRANWIFQMTQTHASSDYRNASRVALAVMSVIPMTSLIFIILFALRPSWAAFVHGVALALLSAILTDAVLLTVNKIPFACSYLPGKAQVHVLFWLEY
jgi:hypothetical protein